MMDNRKKLDCAVDKSSVEGIHKSEAIEYFVSKI